MLHLPRAHLIAPAELPDGTVVWEEREPELGQLLRDGDPVTGWAGDDRLTLCLNTEYRDQRDGYSGPAWEVWRRHEDGTSTIVMRKKGARIDRNVLLRLLAAHDTRHVNVIDQVAKANAANEKSLDDDFGDYVEDRADRLAWALGRDLEIPAQSGRYYPLSDDAAPSQGDSGSLPDGTGDLQEASAASSPVAS